MKAIQCTSFDESGTLALADVPRPPLASGAARVAVAAAGVNFADSLMIAGKYQEKPPLPFTPGLELAGTVIEIAVDAKDVKPGDRVMATIGHGAFAEEAVLPADHLVRIPDAMDFVTAAGFPVAYGTSHVALEMRARLKPGEILLVHGAAGGVGLTAVEIGKAMGAVVIATAGGPEKLEIARRHGADHLIDYSSENIRDRVRELTNGAGADVVYDPVGGDAFEASLRSAAWGARLIVVGFAAGRVQQIPANILLVKNVDVIGLYWGSYRARDPETLRRSYERLFAWYEAGKLKPHVSATLELAQAGEAIELLRRRRSTGKIVLTTGRSGI